MQVPVFLEALPLLLLEPVAVGLGEELVLVEEALVGLAGVIDATELVTVESVELVLPSEEELEDDSVAELVDTVELTGIVSVVVNSAVELTADDTAVLAVADATRLLDIVKVGELVKLCVVVTSAVLVEASVEELATAVLWAGFPVPTGLTYTVSVFDD